MKVMHFIHGLSTGGAETLVKEYVLKIDRNKFDIVVLCFEHYNESPYEKILADNKIRVIYVSDYMLLKNKNNFISRVIKHIERKLLVKRFIRNENPDILHTHLCVNSYVKFAKPSKRTKLFHTVHSEPSITWHGSKRKRNDFKCAQFLVKNNGMRFIVLHDKMRKEVNELFNVDNSIVLNNGIDFFRFNKASINDKNLIKERLNIPYDSCVIGHIGRFVKSKNHKFLVNVFNDIHKKNDKSFLLLIGDGVEKKDIKFSLDDIGLKDNYLILSNRNDIPDLLSIMDYFVFPSIYEGLGIVLIEAQKMNLPCFVSDKVPKNATISNLVTRISLEKESKEWADIILNYKLPKKVTINDKEWDINTVVKKLENIYENKI